MEIVQKHNTSARRLYIRGHNGKVYPYLVMNDGCLTESRREERVLQLFRMMNHLLGKQKVRSVSVNSYIIKSCLRLCSQSLNIKQSELIAIILCLVAIGNVSASATVFCSPSRGCVTADETG
jgi:hypothetical protein